MYWTLTFCVIWLSASQANGQRRAAVDYVITLPEEVESVSENPLSSSINSIQTGREELTGFHRGDPMLDSPFRRGYQKTTTPDYFKESVTKSDSASAGKEQQISPTKPTEIDARAGQFDGDKGPGAYEVPIENRRSVLTSLIRDEGKTGSALPSSSSVRSGSTPKLDRSAAERSSETKDAAKGNMDVANKAPTLRDPSRRTNTHEARRQSVAQSSSSSRYNTTVKDNTERHREEFPPRINSDRRPTVPSESARVHRTVTRSASDKGQVLTHPATPRIPVPRYDRPGTEQPSVSSDAHDRKALDIPLVGKESSFTNADEKKKDFDDATDLHSKVYPKENNGGTTVREDRANSTVINKPTRLIPDSVPAEVPRGRDVYRDEIRGGVKDDLSGKVGSDGVKSFGVEEGRTYVERPYVRDDEERSPGYPDREYTRRHRDRYDERSYDERPVKERPAHRDRERNTTYSTQDRTSGRSSRPRDRGYDEGYRDEVYSERGVVKDTDSRTLTTGRRPYSSRSSDDAEEREKYAADDTRGYRDYSDDRRYRDDTSSTDRGSSRRYNTEGSRKFAEDGSRTYDDDDYYEDKDRYDRRYEKGGDPRRYADDDTRKYTESGSRRYEDETPRRFRTDYDRPARGYKDDDGYTYNGTQRYRDDYDGYRRSSGDSGSSRRYDDTDATRNTRYDDEEYVGSRSYTDRDSDRRYVRRNNDDAPRRKDDARTYVSDDVSTYRDDEEDRRYREETRAYRESSPKDKYDQNDRRAIEGERSAYAGTRTYDERLVPSSRREYDDINRYGDNNGSRRSRGDERNRNLRYGEDDYFINRTSTSYVDRDDELIRSQRTSDDSLGSAPTDSDNPKYISRSNEERRRNRDRTYADIPASRRTDTDTIPRDKSRVYDEDRRTDRRRDDSYDDRTYARRDDDDYSRDSRDRKKDYDIRTYRDSYDEAVTPNSRVSGDDRYRGDAAVRDRVADDEFKQSRPVSGRNRDRDYVDRRYEEELREKASDGTYRYREEDERYRKQLPEVRKPEYADEERRSRGTQRFPDDYDPPYDRDSSIPRSSDERRRGGDRPNRREDRLAGDHVEYDDKVPERPLVKVDSSVRRGTEPELPVPRSDGSLLKEERSKPYDEERRSDGIRSPSRSGPVDARIPRTEYTSGDALPKPRSSEDSADRFDKGDFARGRRRTSLYNEEDRTDSDREEGMKRSRDERHLRRTGDDEELSYTLDDKIRISADDTKDLRQSDRPNSRPTVESHTYSGRRDNSETNRPKTKDEIQPNSGASLDSSPASKEREYLERSEGIAKPTVSQSGEDSQRRRYSSTSSSHEGGGFRRRLPNVREPEADRARRREETEYKSADPLPTENRGRYHYTKSRGDPEDFPRRTADDSFAAGDEYIPRETNSKSRDEDRRDTLKGEYGSPGSGTPTRNKEHRISAYPDRLDKDEYYPPDRDKAPPPSRSGKPAHDAPDFDRPDKVPQDRTHVGRDEGRGTYGNGEYPPRSSPHDETKSRVENVTRDHHESSSGEVRLKKENDRNSPTVSQTLPVRGHGSSISRSATPIPHYQDKEFVSRNVSSRNVSDRFPGVSVTREKRFQYDDRSGTHNSTRSFAVVNEELSKRPLTPKEVIEAAYRHSDEPEKRGEVVYPVYVPGSSNMTSPDVIRPSERRGITTPTKKKKKK